MLPYVDFLGKGAEPLIAGPKGEVLSVSEWGREGPYNLRGGAVVVRRY
jgi:hypothetical protein